MPTPPDPHSKLSGTYFVQDKQNVEELERLRLQDQMVTAGMGGVLPEQSDPPNFRRVLDVGCGTGGWLIEMAKTYPSISLLVGVDINETMISYARAQAHAEEVGDRIEFHTMDALRMLELPTGYFDLVNHRFAQGWMRKWEWPKLLQEYRRMARHGGIIRLTETDAWDGNSPTLKRLTELPVQAAYMAGYLFHPKRDGLTSELVSLLQRAGLQQVQTRTHTLHFHAGTAEGNHFSEVIRLSYRTGAPFMRKWTQMPENYEDLCKQLLQEMQQPDFVATMGLLTAWGLNPPTV